MPNFLFTGNWKNRKESTLKGSREVKVRNSEKLHSKREEEDERRKEKPVENEATTVASQPERSS